MVSGLHGGQMRLCLVPRNFPDRLAAPGLCLFYNATTFQGIVPSHPKNRVTPSCRPWHILLKNKKTPGANGTDTNRNPAIRQKMTDVYIVWLKPIGICLELGSNTAESEYTRVVGSRGSIVLVEQFRTWEARPCEPLQPRFSWNRWSGSASPGVWAWLGATVRSLGILKEIKIALRLDGILLLH